MNRTSSMCSLRAFGYAFLIMTLGITAYAQDAGPKPKLISVNRGQTLSLSLLTELDSAGAKVGDEVTAKLDRPLIAAGETILPTGWIVHGTVTKVKRAGKNCHDGEVEWKLRFVITPSGERIQVQQVKSYPYHPNQTGDPEWVPLDTPWKKIGRAPVFIGEAAVVVALSPFTIPMAIAATEPCRGQAGRDPVMPAGVAYLYAVSKDIRLQSLP
ncbi:MAG TPA: hypothetical protein VE377_27335 [Candidatus Dormibacteraeota bacterium]|nr:hypothetical protein [Candidatus Dormibacteraeota bacterium]